MGQRSGRSGPPADRPGTADGPTDGTDRGDRSLRDRSGVRAELVVRDLPAAPVAEALSPGAVAEDVERVRRDGTVVSQFRADRTADAELVFDGGGTSVYRRRTRVDERLPSEVVESLGHPVSAVTVRTAPARVRLALSLPAVDPLAEVVDAVEATGASVGLERLTSSGGPADRSDPVVVDRARLTDRQLEVVRTAHRLGYFDHPRGASATEVADAIGIARSTFSEHLAAAQRRVFEALVGG